MTIYTTLPQDDSNLNVELTESNDLVTLNLQVASFTGTGSGDVSSVNGQTGDVELTTDDITPGVNNLYYDDIKVQDVIDTNIAGFATTTYTNSQDSSTLVLANAYTDNQLLLNVPATTDDLPSGTTNLYYTDSRVDTFLTDGSVSSINFGGNTSLSWNATDHTLDMPLDGITIQLGQESVARVVNKTGNTILNGTVVRTTGSQGQRMTVGLASNLTDNLSATVLGVATEDIPNNQEGFINVLGLVRGIDTSAFTEGAPLYLGVNGGLIQTLPVSPAHAVLIGYCIRSHHTQGSIFVKAQNGYELGELHDVLITAPVTGEVLQYNSVTDLWVNQALDFVTDTELGVIVGVLNGAITTGDSNTLSAANAYTDSQIAAIPPTDLTGYATETYVGSAIAAISLGVSDLNDTDIVDVFAKDALVWNGSQWVNGLPGGIEAEGQVSIIANQQSRFKFKTRFSAPDDIYNSDLTLHSLSDPDNNIVQSMRWKTTGQNDFLTVLALDTGGGDDGTHATEMQLRGDGATIKNDNLNLTIESLDDLILLSGLDGVKIQDQYYLPNVDGTQGQVITTDGAGVLGWSTVSGGGASALDDLTDVEVVTPLDGDILRYNGVSTTWQNTNLGLSLTPTLSADANQFLVGSALITNWGDYDDPAAFVELYDGATLVVANADITVDPASGEISWNFPGVNTTYTLKVIVQDFGDLASDLAEISITKLSTTFRYWRVGEFTAASSSNFGLYNFRLYTANGQTGTMLPPNMTDATTPAPFVASSSYFYSATYADWKVFDTAPGGWNWWLGSPSPMTAAWSQIDLGAAYEIKSFTVGPIYSATFATCKVWASNTGAFAGEESLIATINSNFSAPSTIYNIG